MTPLRKKYLIPQTVVILFALFSILSTANGATLEVGAGKKYSTIQEAVNSASAGDVINIYSGIYTENIVIDGNANPSRNGTEANPVKLQPAEEGVIIDANHKGTGIYIHRLSWWVFGSDTYQMEIRNGYKGNLIDPFEVDGGGIMARGKGNHTIKNIKIKGTKTVYGFLGSGEHQVGVVADIYFAGINNSTVKNCILISEWADHNLILHFGRNNIVIGNKLSGSIRQPFYNVDHFNLLLEKNYILSYPHKTFPPGVDPIDSRYGSIVRESTNHVIRYNVFEVIEDPNYKYNREEALLIYDSGTADLDIGSEAHKVYNNVFIGGTKASLILAHRVQGSDFYNNIFINDGACVEFASSGTYLEGHYFDHNIYDCGIMEYDRGGFGLDTYRTLGANNLNVDATLIKSGLKPIPYYYPLPESPTLKGGIAVEGFEGTDFAGVTVPLQSPDIGPFQASSETEPPVQDTTPPQPPVLLAID